MAENIHRTHYSLYRSGSKPDAKVNHYSRGVGTSSAGGSAAGSAAGTAKASYPVSKRKYAGVYQTFQATFFAFLSRNPCQAFL